jgi:hypothetical protein
VGSVNKHIAEPIRHWSNRVHSKKELVSRQINHLEQKMEHWLIGLHTPLTLCQRNTVRCEIVYKVVYILQVRNLLGPT